MVKYCVKTPDSKCVKTRGDDVRVHYKNTIEAATAIKGRSLPEARQYLEAVIDGKRCVPFKKHKLGIGRTAQAKEFGRDQGRWPVKSCKILLQMLKNAESNAVQKDVDADNLFIWHVALQRAARGRRRTFRAHGRIGPYMSSPCHIELILRPMEQSITKPTPDAKHKEIKLSKKQLARKQLAPKRIVV